MDDATFQPGWLKEQLDKTKETLGRERDAATSRAERAEEAHEQHEHALRDAGWASVADLHAAYTDVLCRWERAEDALAEMRALVSEVWTATSLGFADVAERRLADWAAVLDGTGDAQRPAEPGTSDYERGRLDALREAAALTISPPGFIDRHQRRSEEHGAELLRAEIRKLAQRPAEGGPEAEWRLAEINARHWAAQHPAPAALDGGQPATEEQG
jgi:hypothetical protein